MTTALNFQPDTEAEHKACMNDTQLRVRALAAWPAAEIAWQTVYDATQAGSLSRSGSEWLARAARHMAVLRALTGRDHSVSWDGYLTRARCEAALVEAPRMHLPRVVEG